MYVFSRSGQFPAEGNKHLVNVPRGTIDDSHHLREKT